jgi:putative DNA primase/helicase
MHPTIKPIPIESIPPALTERRQWVMWRAEIDGKRVPIDTDKARKVPYQINNNRASSTNPQQWATFDAVVKRYARGGYDGIGYVFSKDDPFVGIDLDDCIDSTGAVRDWAAIILADMRSHAEVSPSGKGIKVWVKGSIPKSMHPERKDIPDSVIPADQPGLIEIYDQGRYFTVTGQAITNVPIRAVNGELDSLWQSLQKPIQAPEKPAQPRTDAIPSDDWIGVIIERGPAHSGGCGRRQ